MNSSSFIRTLRHTLLALCALPVMAVAPAWANPFEFRFSNGLRLIVKEDRRAPTAVQQVWYRAGSIDEAPGVTGVAHVLEHMMFKGTRKHPGGEFSRLVAEAGGRENAFTGTDYTAYFQQVHRDRLEPMLRLESDRMANLLVSPAEFAKEIRVVMEERRLRTEDRPRALVHEALRATAFASHPYRWPVVGWMTDLDRMTAGDARAWYDAWYAPNNAVVVVVGDVDASKVRAWVADTYGRIKSKPLRQRREIPEPEQRGRRDVSIRAQAEFPYVMLGWKVPALRKPSIDWEPYALEMLAGVLAGNDSARLGQRLVRERRIATSADASYDYVSRGPGFFLLDAQAAPGTTAAELEAALREELALIVREGIDAAELARVKAQVVAAAVYKRDSMFAQAMEIGILENAGLSHSDADRILDKLRLVSAEQVRAVAASYFSEERMTVATLVPLPPVTRPAADAAAPASPAKH